MTQMTISARIPYSSHNIPGSKFLIRKSVFSWVRRWEPGASRLVGLASHLPIIIVRSLAQFIKDVKFVLWTPIRDCSCKPNLLWVISNVWSKTEDCTTEVTVWTFDNLWRFHIRLKRCKCKLKALVIELSAELLVCRLLSLRFACWKIILGIGRLQVDYMRIPFGIGRNANGTTPLPCPRWAVLVMVPEEA